MVKCEHVNFVRRQSRTLWVQQQPSTSALACWLLWLLVPF